jgi:hypothetical protein
MDSQAQEVIVLYPRYSAVNPVSHCQAQSGGLQNQCSSAEVLTWHGFQFWQMPPSDPLHCSSFLGRILA